MCPVCLATAVLIASSATSTGGLTTIAIKKFGVKKAVTQKTGAVESVPESRQRRD
jgi:hypothetical protein